MPKLPKLNFKGLANAIKNTQPGNEQESTESESPIIKQDTNSLKSKTSKTKNKTPVKKSKNKEYQIYNRGVTLSLIDKLSLGGILPEVAVDKIEELMNVDSEIYLRSDSKSRLVNILILEEDDLKGTCLDASIAHKADATEIGLFTQRCAYNLRNFAAPGSLFNVNHPMSLKYGDKNHQILLLANVATLETLESKFNVSDPNPLKFRLGVMRIPETRLEPLPMRIPEQSSGYTIGELKRTLLKTADQRLYDAEDKLFDFNPDQDADLWNN